MPVFAVGLWTVKEGRQNDFVEAWMELGARLREDFPERRATLLHDRDQPNLFISFGPSESLGVLEGRREALGSLAQESETLGQRTAQLFETLDHLDLHTLDLVGEIE
jgi:hypothetical protein